MTTIAKPDADSAARPDLLERYARLAIRVGINLEPGRVRETLRQILEGAEDAWASTAPTSTRT